MKLEKILICFTLLCLPQQSVHAESKHWVSDSSGNKLQFTGHYEDTRLDGEFSNFSVRLSSTPDGMPLILEVLVDTGSAEMYDEDLNQTLKDPDWFDSHSYPGAGFISSAIRPAGDRRYLAVGLLKLKGVSSEVTVPFVWSEDSGGGSLEGSFQLSRTRWKIGTGEWARVDTVADGVEIQFVVRLRAKD